MEISSPSKWITLFNSIVGACGQRYSGRLKPFEEMLRALSRGEMGAFLIAMFTEYPDPVSFPMSFQVGRESSIFGVKLESLDRKLRTRGDYPVEASAAQLKMMMDFEEELEVRNLAVPVHRLTHYVWVREGIRDVTLSPVGRGYTSVRSFFE